MKKIEVAPNSKFKEWTVIAEVEKRSGRRAFRVRCSCGNISIITLDKLRSNTRQHCKNCVLNETGGYLTQESLKKILDYDQESGVFTWLKGKMKGCTAGSFSKDGYLETKISGKNYRIHRPAFLWMDGYTPELQVDHINGDRADNRWENLRHVSKFCNMQNITIGKRNTSGFPGVCFDKKANKWSAEIHITRKKFYLGLCPTPIEAALARLTMEIWHPGWICNHRPELVKRIKSAWPKFNDASLS